VNSLRPNDSEPRDEPGKVLPAQQARQGTTGHNVRYVLGLSLLAVIIAFAAIYIAYVV
jgi:hypothetical protein